jgi:hypothetical protein
MYVLIKYCFTNLQHKIFLHVFDKPNKYLTVIKKTQLENKMNSNYSFHFNMLIQNVI